MRRSNPEPTLRDYRAESAPSSRSSGGWFSSFRAPPSPNQQTHPNDGCPGCMFRARWGMVSAHLQVFSMPGLHSGFHDGEQVRGSYAIVNSRLMGELRDFLRCIASCLNSSQMMNVNSPAERTLRFLHLGIPLGRFKNR